MFQELRLDGNRLKRVPTESLGGPTSLRDLHLQDNVIGKFPWTNDVTSPRQAPRAPPRVLWVSREPDNCTIPGWI